MNPYQPPAAFVADGNTGRFRWIPALLGGAAGAGLYHAGVSIIVPLAQHWYVSHGIGAKDLFVILTASPAVLGAYAVLNVICIAIGAMTAIRLADGRPLTHAVASVAVPYFVSGTRFLGVYLGVSSLSGTVWSHLLFFLLPIPSALLGGWLYIRRTQKR